MDKKRKVIFILFMAFMLSVPVVPVVIAFLGKVCAIIWAIISFSCALIAIFLESTYNNE
jgi:hypothetical protein